MDPGPFGSLGTGPGYALGAKIARRNARVFIIFGDGGFGFNGFVLSYSFINYGCSAIESFF